jgi:hypothetical protein
VRYKASPLGSINTAALRVHIDSKGSTSKTTVVSTLCAGIDAIAAKYSLPSPILRGALTRVAAHNIGGQTLYLLLRLPVKKVEDLLAALLKALQTRFKPINYLIIDEKSIIGL